VREKDRGGGEGVGELAAVATWWGTARKSPAAVGSEGREEGNEICPCARETACPRRDRGQIRKRGKFPNVEIFDRDFL
jgi:hypothetical protein